MIIISSYLSLSSNHHHNHIGKYSIPSIFKKKKRTSSSSNPQSKNIINNEALIKSLGAPALTTAPSIPTRFQGYGYEQGPDGRLQLQDPLYPVYTGKNNQY
jgi:hypothetical protein